MEERQKYVLNEIRRLINENKLRTHLLVRNMYIRFLEETGLPVGENSFIEFADSLINPQPEISDSLKLLSEVEDEMIKKIYLKEE